MSFSSLRENLLTIDELNREFPMSKWEVVAGHWHTTSQAGVGEIKGWQLLLKELTSVTIAVTDS